MCLVSICIGVGIVAVCVYSVLWVYIFVMFLQSAIAAFRASFVPCLVSSQQLGGGGHYRGKAKGVGSPFCSMLFD